MTVEIRKANAAEKWAIEDYEISNKPRSYSPEKSKYYDIWCDVEKILLEGEDAILTFSDSEDREYSLYRVQKGLVRMAKNLRSQDRIDFQIRTQTIIVLEPCPDIPNISYIKERHLQIRAIFD